MWVYNCWFKELSPGNLQELYPKEYCIVKIYMNENFIQNEYTVVDEGYLIWGNKLIKKHVLFSCQSFQCSKLERT